MQDWLGWVVAGLAAAVAVALGVTLRRSRSRTDHALAQSRAETEALRAQLEALEQRLTRPAGGGAPAEAEFVITHLGEQAAEPSPPAVPPRIGAALFADLVLRETVVKTASLAYGVRRALDPATRNRIRFEMRRELKRVRKQRRADLRTARREWQARRRAEGNPEGSAA